MQIAEKLGSVYNGIKDVIRFLISKQNVFAAAERRKRFGLRAKKIENEEGEWMMRWRKRTAAKLCAVFMVCSMLAGLLPVSVPAQGAEQKEAVWNGKRQVLNFNREWKFIRQDAEGAEAEEYNDSGWYHVGLPHDFSIPYWQEESHYVGYGWYRKVFTAEKDWAGKQTYMDFEGVFHTAEIYINGTYVTKHRGGYTGFEVDITDYLNEGGNLVAIRVNNVWDAALAPRAGEHMFTGGIYRNVSLVVTSPVHVAWYGTFAQTPEISAESAKVRMQAEVQNDSDSEQKVKVEHHVLDADGKPVLNIESAEQSIPAGETLLFDDTSEAITNPHLWSVEDPYLYQVQTEVFIGGESTDQYETPLGFRWVEWTSDQGFFLNGEHVWLDGANAHQDHAGWANAVTTDALKRDVHMIKEAGMNFIRGSHYPHAPAYAEACDKEGILFWSEAAFWSTYGFGEGTAGTSDDYKSAGYPTTHDKETEAAFEQSCMDNVRDMIRINRNHPSVIIWSMGNEPFFGNGGFDNEKKALISKMAAYAKQLDPTRATAMGGTQRGGYDKLDNIDVAGYNGDGAKMSEYQDPGVANMVAEYGSHTANRTENDGFQAYYGDVQRDGDGNPIEYPWRSGISLWCAFHHGSIAARSYGDMGFIDYYRLPLRAWYYYREKRTGVADEHSVNGMPAKLSLSTSSDTLTNDGTTDAHIIVTVQDAKGNWVNAAPEVTLEIMEGPGIFPTGKTMTFTKEKKSISDGKAAIEFRSYYAGTTTIRAYSPENPDLEPAEITITTTGDTGETEPDINTMYGAFMGGGGYVDNPVEEPKHYRYHNCAGNPIGASSNDADRENVFDGDASTEWKADKAGSGQWLYVEVEHGGINLYRAELVFGGKAYPYQIQYKRDNIDEAEWKTLVAYDKESVRNRPKEECFFGTYMRYVRILFTDVPENEYANLAELKLYGIHAEQNSYATGYQYLSDLEWKSAAESAKKDASAAGGTLLIGEQSYRKGIGMTASPAGSEVVYDFGTLEKGYARFCCTVGLDAKSGGRPEVLVQVYGDNQLMYAKKLTGKTEICPIDISVSKVKELKLVATEAGTNGSSYVDWADAKLMGATRDIGKEGTGMEATYFSDTETLVPGRDFAVTADFKNSGETSRRLAASLALYTNDGMLVSTKMDSFTVNPGEALQHDFSIHIPEELPTGGYVQYMAWDAGSLLPVTETVASSRVAGDPEKDKYSLPSDEDDGSTGEDLKDPPPLGEGEEYETEYKVPGKEERLEKTGSWGYWTTSQAIDGYETYIDNWQNSGLKLNFTGVQAALCAKVDGSKKGAEIYIDGTLAETVSTNGSPDSYTVVFQSGKLPFGAHTIEVKPTGKFGFDYISFYTGKPEDRTALVKAVEECGKLKKEDYADGWDAFSKALLRAVNISTKAGYTQDDIDSALKRLNGAKEALVVKTNRKEDALKEAVADSLTMIESGRAKAYTTFSKEGFTDILLEASSILANKALTQEKLDRAATDLRNAWKKMEESSENDLEALREQLLNALKQMEEAKRAEEAAQKRAEEAAQKAWKAQEEAQKAKAEAEIARTELKKAIEAANAAQKALEELRKAQQSTKKVTISTDKKKYTVKKGKKVTIKAKASDGSRLTFRSSNKKVAAVTAKGVVKGVRKGKAVITVKCKKAVKKVKVTVK